MTWQDIVLMGSSFLFTVALVPALRSPVKPPSSGSLLTTLLLGVNVCVFVTLHLWLAAISTVVNCIAWGTLTWQTRMDGSMSNILCAIFGCKHSKWAAFDSGKLIVSESCFRCGKERKL